MSVEVSPWKGRRAAEGGYPERHVVYCADLRFVCDCRCGCRAIRYANQLPGGWIVRTLMLPRDTPVVSGHICLSCRWHQATLDERGR